MFVHVLMNKLPVVSMNHLLKKPVILETKITVYCHSRRLGAYIASLIHFNENLSLFLVC